MSAWCLGVLNSHRKFLLSYCGAGRLERHDHRGTRLVWPARQSSTTSQRRRRGPRSSAPRLQLLVQVPYVLRLVAHLRLSLDWSRTSVRTVLTNFAPVGVSRGVVQISAYIDQVISSFLPNGMVSLLVLCDDDLLRAGEHVRHGDLGGGASGDGERDRSAMEERARQLRERLNAGLRHIAFFVDPVGDGDARRRRRDGGGALSAWRPVLRPGYALHVGDSRGLGGRAAREHDRTSVLVDVLRAARHANAASHSRRSASY